ncbi:MAG: PRC-barrel domain-containing protein [Deltaproteobacteria bacterium]|nr:PRC-barrel domain-containing protein [Deltaproteobacteria bacterium]
MLRKLHEIQGMQVVALSEGRVMGSVQKVYLSPSQKRVSGIRVRESGLGGDESWVDIKDVDKIGEDVVFVNRASSCKAKQPVGRSLKDMMGMPIGTKDGKILGTLVDFEVDEQWRVVELTLSDYRMIKIDHRQAVFGEDTILLEAGADERLRTAPRHKVGFLARVFGAETIQEAASAITRAEQAKAARPQELVETSPGPAKASRARRPTRRKKTASKKKT